MSESARLKMNWLLILGFVMVYLWPIAYRPMIVPDEVRYAEIPREMIATGDWIVPRLNGLPYFEKPVMGYWLNALAMLAFGKTAFAVPVVIIVPYMIWVGRWRDLLPMAVIPILAATLVVLPWAIAVHLKAPDYWNYFFWQEHVKRFMPDDTIEHKAPGNLLNRNAERVTPYTALVSLEDPLRAVCWFYRRSDVYQLGPGGELAYGLTYPEASQRLLDPARFRILVSTHETGRVVLVGKTKHYRHLKNQLPPPVYEDSSGPGGYVFAQY